MIRKQLKAGQLFTHHQYVYQVTRTSKRNGSCPFLKKGPVGLCIICRNKIPLGCYPKLIK